jgi:hypothetical protein
MWCPSGWAYLEAAFHFLDEALERAAEIGPGVEIEGGAVSVCEGSALVLTNWARS